MTVLPETGRRFSVRVPPNWFEVDLWRATRTGELARMVDQRIAESPAMAPYRAAMLKFLREVATDAERRGVVFAAAMTEPIDDRLLVATVLAFITSGPPGDDGNDPDVIAAQLIASAPPASAGDGAARTWRRVALSEVPAGRCVRVAGVEVTEVSDGRSAECVLMHTLVPVPGIHQVLDLVLVSPEPELAEPMLDLFDAISGTLTWTDPSSQEEEEGGGTAAPAVSPSST